MKIEPDSSFYCLETTLKVVQHKIMDEISSFIIIYKLHCLQICLPLKLI